MDATLLEKLVKALRNNDPSAPKYEALLGDPMSVKQYANIGLQCSEEFTTAAALITHMYCLNPDEKGSKQIKAYTTALADFIDFFTGCANEVADGEQPEVPNA
jgi:hypothetical protein